MTDNTIITLQIITLVLTATGPLILALAMFIKNIKHSRCCGSHVEIERSNLEDPVKDENYPLKVDY